jgi:hypothetical protein
MIKRKTVLVLGAGASKPYKFPLGSELLTSIRGWNQSSLRGDLSGLSGALGFTPDQIVDFARALDRSGVASIDTFLARRDDLARIGKLAIAYEIAKQEHSAHIHDARNGDDWYRYLWNRMIEDADDLRHVSSNPLRVVTFNYDRYLERFLFDCACNTFKVSANDAQSFVDQFPINHVYGQVGKFHFAAADGCPKYAWVAEASVLQTRADGIRIFPEARHDDEKFREIRDWFGWAEDICFLGFGFDKLNCDRLNLPSVQRSKAEQQQLNATVYASIVGLTQVEKERAQRSTSPNVGWQTENLVNLKFLRSHPLQE